MLQEWSPQNNLRPDEVTLESSRRVMWVCSACFQHWQAVVSNRLRRIGVPTLRASGQAATTPTPISVSQSYHVGALTSRPAVGFGDAPRGISPTRSPLLPRSGRFREQPIR